MQNIIAIITTTAIFTSASISSAQETKSVKFAAPAGFVCAKATSIRADGAIVTRNVCVKGGK